MLCCLARGTILEMRKRSEEDALQTRVTQLINGLFAGAPSVGLFLKLSDCQTGFIMPFTGAESTLFYKNRLATGGERRLDRWVI